MLLTDRQTDREFQPSDKSHFCDMLRAELMLWRLNKTPLWCVRKRNRIIRKLFGTIESNPYNIQIPFHCAYGKNIHCGKDVHMNYNCIIMDQAEVYIGDSVFIGPNVTLSTVVHPFEAEKRMIRKFENTFEPEGRGNIQYIKPISIGNNVWLATGVIVCAGVSIGDNTVIGAGSVVTKDVPANVFACGVPCKVVRSLVNNDI